MPLTFDLLMTFQGLCDEPLVFTDKLSAELLLALDLLVTCQGQLITRCVNRRVANFFLHFQFY
jgi:hypothetical protein